MVSFWRRYLHDFEIALESIRGNKLKSFLTALGIIFGVAAVISMLAIGSGAQREILEQMKQVGVNNILVKVVSQPEGEAQEEEGKSATKRYSPGLNSRDIAAMRAAIPSLRHVAPMVTYEGTLQSVYGRLAGTVVGTAPDYFALYHLSCTAGRLFSTHQAERGELVCVIGQEVRAKLFGQHAPVGGRLKFAGLWFTVIGVLEDAGAAEGGSAEELGPVASRAAIFVPLETLERRYLSRMLRKPATEGEVGMLRAHFAAPLDRLVVQVTDTRYLENTAKVMERLLARLHAGVQDYAVIIPEKLLQQQQRTSSIFNWVLGAIAGISLLVGGIGIMNIMFASVMERIKEIGTRLAIGAKRADIVAQFLWEAILISLSGGLVGIGVGVALSYLITHFAGIETIVSPLSVLISFGVSVGVGLIFGLAPARRAARRSPIESLRYE